MTAEARVGGGTIALIQGDITTIPADAIVNAANSALVGGGGVDGAIHRAGGPAIMADLEARYGVRRRCPTGSAVLSVAGALPARWVIHAVGPIWRGGLDGEPDLLRSAYRSALDLAREADARSVTLPSISTGVYGYPPEPAARIAIGIAGEHLLGPTSVDRITFVLFSREAYDVFAAALPGMSPA